MFEKQIATVRMLHDIKDWELQGRYCSIDLTTWSKWLDMDMEEIIKLQEYCFQAEPIELCNKVLQRQNLCSEERKLSMQYLNTYGITLLKIKNNWGENRLDAFLLNTIDAFVNRKTKNLLLELDFQKLKSGIFIISKNYITEYEELLQKLYSECYSSRIIDEICKDIPI